jgi:hypothetical protein
MAGYFLSEVGFLSEEIKEQVPIVNHKNISNRI